MKLEAFSRTAMYLAFFRAIETAQPKEKRLFEDRLAKIFLDVRFKLALRIATIPFLRNIAIDYIQKQGLGSLSVGIARTKYIDDLVKRAVDEGAKQVIILGAGFDTRAFRLPFLQDMPVVEIDHPNTLRYKLNKLKETIKDLPSNVRYLELDFNKQAIKEFAIKNKIDFSLPTVIIWEGVSSYLSSVAVDKTFEFVKGFAPGTSIIFTYINRLVLDNPENFGGAKELMEILKADEEEWTFGFYPEQLASYLQKYGLSITEDTGATEYRNMYIPERKNLHRGLKFHRVAFVKKM